MIPILPSTNYQNSHVMCSSSLALKANAKQNFSHKIIHVKLLVPIKVQTPCQHFAAFCKSKCLYSPSNHSWHFVCLARTMHSLATKSSLELMLDKIQQKTEQKTEDLPPALPVRPVSKARLPSGKSARPIKFQESDLTNGNRKKEEITRREAFLEQTNQLELPKNEDVEDFVTEANQECSCGDNGGCLVQKTGTMERELHGIIGIQKYFRGHQARCCYHELKRVIIILQSLIRGWLSRRHLKCTKNMKKLSTENAEKKDYVHIPYSDVLELQWRVLKTEAAVQHKKDENGGLRLQLEQYVKKWQQSEAKMKSLEQMWQDQLTSIQVNLVEVAKKNHAAENVANQIGIMDYTPLHHDINVDHTMSTIITHAPNGLLVKTGQPGSDINPEDELRKVKLRFEAWKRDYKSRLHETKATLQKIGSSEVKKSGQKWWEI